MNETGSTSSGGRRTRPPTQREPLSTWQQLLWDSSMSTPAGRAVYLPTESEPQLLALAQPEDDDGRFTVDMLDEAGDTSRISPGDLAAIVRKDDRYVGQGVRLLVRPTASGADPRARALAELLDAEVLAPSRLRPSRDPMEIRPDGFFFSEEPRPTTVHHDDAEWVAYPLR